MDDLVVNEGKTATGGEQKPNEETFASRQNVQDSALQQLADANAALTAETPESHEHGQGISRCGGKWKEYHSWLNLVLFVCFLVFF